MEVIAITEEDIAERDEYCSKKRLAELVKRSTFSELVKDDIILYMTHVRGMKPLAWQFKVLQEYNKGTRKFGIVCSRQIGKTEMCGAIEQYRVEFNKGWADRHCMANMNHTTQELVMSITEDSAFDFLRRIKQGLWNTDAYMEQYRTPKDKPTFGKKYMSSQLSRSAGQNNQSLITLRSKRHGELQGCSVRSLPPTDKILGKTFTGVICDEAARVSGQIVTENLQPTLDAMGKLEMYISTPNGQAGFFYELFSTEGFAETEKEPFKLFMFDIDAIKIEQPERHEKVMAKIKRERDAGRESEISRNYYCSFTSSEDSYFPLDKLDNAFLDDLKPVEELRSIPIVVGMDFGGKVKSHSVMTVSTYPNGEDVAQRLFCIRYPVNKDQNYMWDMENIIMKNYLVKEIVVDHCPASYRDVEIMKDKGWPITEFVFNRTSKPDYFDRFRARICKGQTVTYHDSALREEMANYTTDLKPVKGGTDDLLDSWMLSNVPFLDTSAKFGVHLIGSGKERDDAQKKDDWADSILKEYETRKSVGSEAQGLSRAI